MYIFTYICIYMSMYTYIYTYLCILIYIHTYHCRTTCWRGSARNAVCPRRMLRRSTPPSLPPVLPPSCTHFLPSLPPVLPPSCTPSLPALPALPPFYPSCAPPPLPSTLCGSLQAMGRLAELGLHSRADIDLVIPCHACMRARA